MEGEFAQITSYGPLSQNRQSMDIGDSDDLVYWTRSEYDADLWLFFVFSVFLIGQFPREGVLEIECRKTVYYVELVKFR